MIFYTKVKINYVIISSIVILVGDMGVGKSSLMSQYIKNKFPESPLPTIAIEFATKLIKVKEGGFIKAQIWDTAGEEKYKSITAHHYRKSVGALLVYDVTRKSTFDDCIKWYTELKNYTDKNCVICLVGNKTDLVECASYPKEVQFEEAQKFAEEYDMLFFESSAKDNKKVTKIFEELLQQIYNKRRKIGKDDLLTRSFIIKKNIYLENKNNTERGCLCGF